MANREHGYTFLGRYTILDRASHTQGWDWPINDVFTHFGSDISDVLSIGCSVGLNEVILGINHPEAKIIGADIDAVAIQKASAGVWKLDDIRPSGFAIPEDDKTLFTLYTQFCPEGYFEIDFFKGILKLVKPVANVSFEVQDGIHTQYSDNTFDLIMMHMFGGEHCSHYTPAFVSFGNEMRRIIKPEGLIWNEWGLFQAAYIDNSSPIYRRVLHKGITHQIEADPISLAYLFPPPEANN